MTGGAILITGATGFVGMEVLARLVERTDRPVRALVRASGPEEADARLRSGLAAALGDGRAGDGRLVAVPGDVQAPGLGLSPRTRAALADEVTDVVHAAASVSFGLPLDEARAINVEGTRNVLELAREGAARGGLRRLCHVSTAYVAGDHPGRFDEDDLEVGQAFHNSYERSKFEAERLVRRAGRELEVQVVRPSIVVGERPSGWTGAFNVLYTPLAAFARGALAAVPARESSPVDVVPVDYVADAVASLATGPPGDAGTFHLVAGDQATTVGRLMRLASEVLGRRRPAAIDPGLYERLVHPLVLRRANGRQRHAIERLEAFFPYLARRGTYDDERARRRLEDDGVRASPVEDYFDRLVRFAERARWGKEPVGRAQARSEAAARHDLA